VIEQDQRGKVQEPEGDSATALLLGRLPQLGHQLLLGDRSLAVSLGHAADDGVAEEAEGQSDEEDVGSGRFHKKPAKKGWTKIHPSFFKKALIKIPILS